MGSGDKPNFCKQLAFTPLKKLFGHTLRCIACICQGQRDCFKKASMPLVLGDWKILVITATKLRWPRQHLICFCQGCDKPLNEQESRAPVARAVQSSSPDVAEWAKKVQASQDMKAVKAPGITLKELLIGAAILSS